MNRLNVYVLRQFISPLFATFFIVIFVFLMQFLWMFVDDLVGKGLPTLVVLEFFYYAILRLVLQALPLTILLSSIMTFGSLGERLELLSMKAAGISLFKIMRPLTILVILMTIGSYAFINTVEPNATRKLATLRFDISRKNPAMNLKAGQFNKDIEGIAIKIDKKDKETGMLYGFQMYQHNDEEGANSNVTLADSGTIAEDSITNVLTMTLYSGKEYRNLKEQGKRYDKEKVPFRIDTFSMRVMIFENEEDLKRSNDKIYGSMWFTKGLVELKESIDSLKRDYTRDVVFDARGVHRGDYKMGLQLEKDQNFDTMRDSLVTMDADSIFRSQSINKQTRVVETALSFADNIKQKSEHKKKRYESDWYRIRKHAAEMHKRHTVPVSCLIFFFIGAPLGAIIRKGGFGLPVVISIFLFIIWYILDTFGAKMATEGISPIWVGKWMANIILAIISIFLTFQAATDSVLMNTDNYFKGIKKIFHRISTKKQ